MDTAILFAAGLGTRLLPLTDLVAKPALPVLDVPLGAWSLASLRPVSEEPVVNVSHLPGSIVRALQPFGPFQIFVERPTGFGTAGTLKALADRIPERAITANADLVSDVDIRDVIATHERLGMLATVVVKTVEGGADLLIDGDVAVDFIDRRERSAAGGLFIGIAILESDVIAALPDKRPLGLAEAVLSPLARTGHLGVHVHDGYASDVGTFERYLATSLDVLDGKVSPPADLPGRIVDVEKGRAYVGPDANVTEDSLGQGAIVLAGASVPEGARVESSIVWPKTALPRRAELSGAVYALGRNLMLR